MGNTVPTNVAPGIFAENNDMFILLLVKLGESFVRIGDHSINNSCNMFFEIRWGPPACKSDRFGVLLDK